MKPNYLIYFGFAVFTWVFVTSRQGREESSYCLLEYISVVTFCSQLSIITFGLKNELEIKSLHNCKISLAIKLTFKGGVVFLWAVRQVGDISCKNTGESFFVVFIKWIGDI